MKLTGKALAYAFAFVLMLSSCKTLITTYDPYSYTQLASLKVEVINAMSKATDEYATHATEAEAVKLQIQKAYEYDTHKPKNEVMSKMWQYLYESLLSEEMEGLTDRKHKKGFFPNWREAKKKSELFVSEASDKIVAPMFDLLLELESKKLTQTAAEAAFAAIKQKLGVTQ